MDLCKATALLIANGRLDTDRSIGEFTCVTSRGRSVVDYLLLSLCDFECVSHFSICDVDEHSEHSALYFCLKLMNKDVTYNHRKNASTPTKKLVLSCNNQELFRSTLVNQFGKYNNLITRLDSDNISVNEVVEFFSKYLFDGAFCLFGKTINCDSDNQPKITNMSNPWFDNTCKTAKQNFNRAKHAHSRCRSNEHRVNLTRCRTSLNKAKRRAQAVSLRKLFKYTEKLITVKLKIFRRKIQIFFIFLLKTYIVGTR